MSSLSGLEKLPVELIHEIQLIALSENLPLVNRWMLNIFKASHSSYRADYVFRRFLSQTVRRDLVTYALQFPICSENVLSAILRLSSNTQYQDDNQPQLPRRLFKVLSPRPTRWGSSDAPLPFLRYLYTDARICSPNANAHDGYALSRAVYVGFRPLVEFLLKHGASPKPKDALAVRIAIKKRDLALVRMLVERTDDDDDVGGAGGRGFGKAEDGVSSPVKVETKKKSTKRRRLIDRLEVTTAMLRLAVEVDARDIVEYFLDKGARPDMLTLQRMRTGGFA
ncbi:hypothetical protein M0805_007225 [Coniferiporia weirii]|nr:hypothetical protein M0805_007225 [Coniferiporia weirii]